MINENKRFKKKLSDNSVRDPQTKCLIWTGGTSGGYGKIRYDKKFIMYTHRLAWLLHYGELNDGDIVHHKCANKKCINIKHLQLVSSIDNVAEMFGRKAYIKKINELEKRLEECNCEQTKATGN